MAILCFYKYNIDMVIADETHDPFTLNSNNTINPFFFVSYPPLVSVNRHIDS